MRLPGTSSARVRSPRGRRSSIARCLARLARLRVLLVALVVPLALSWSMPALARAVAGPPAHVCHCDMRHGHATCACPKCFPDREDLACSEDALRGQCGDDDATLRERSCLDAGVLGAPFVLGPAPGGTITPPPAVRAPDSVSQAPPRRPPKRLAAR